MTEKIAKFLWSARPADAEDVITPEIAKAFLTWATTDPWAVVRLFYLEESQP